MGQGWAKDKLSLISFLLARFDHCLVYSHILKAFFNATRLICSGVRELVMHSWNTKYDMDLTPKVRLSKTC